MRILSRFDPVQLADFHARGLWQRDTIYDLARKHAVGTPDGFAYRDRFRRLTWASARTAVDALASDLSARGLKPGDRVAFWLPDRIESVLILLACSNAGFVACPSPHRNHTTAEVVGLLQRLNAAALFYEPGFGADARGAGSADAIEATAAALPSMRHVYRLPQLTADDAARLPYDALLTAGPANPSQTPAGHPDRVSYIAFTSGSTGAPKGVMHSDNTQLLTARAICRDWAIGRDDVVATLSPFSHNLGVGAALTALVAGAELVIHDTPRTESLIDRLTEAGVTYLVGVPTHALDLIAEAERRGLQQLAHVRAMRVSGAACPPQAMHGLMALGVEPQSGYGMTENNSHQYTRPGDDPELITGSCGRACDGYEIGIFDPADRDRRLDPGEIGLVAGRGACLMLGYFADQAATEAAFNADGWFMTGDLGMTDTAGYLCLTGRQKDVLIRGGHNISPARIEDLAAAFDGLARVALLALPDPRLGERICLAYVARSGAEIEPRLLLAYLAARGLSRYEIPEFLAAVSEMPLMANGKIDKSALLRDIAEGHLRPVPAVLP